MNEINNLSDMTMTFAVDIIELVKQLKSYDEDVISRQLCRCATAIGANVNLAGYARNSGYEIAPLLDTALKESDETVYWLELLYRTEYISDHKFQSLLSQCSQIRLLLIQTKKEV